MPKYNRIKYGKLHKYGKYILTGGGGTDGFTLGKHTRYRIRFHSHKGKVSETLTLSEDRISIPTGPLANIRMRANGSDWVTVQQEQIDQDRGTMRIRSIGNKKKSEWVYSDRANLTNI